LERRDAYKGLGKPLREIFAKGGASEMEKKFTREIEI
jgi:hypothetical protein